MTFLFRSVRRNGTRALPFAVLSPAHRRCISVPFPFRSVMFGPRHSRSVIHHAHARRSSCKKNLVESEIAFASVIKTPLFEYLPSCLSLETAPCS